MPSVQSFLTSDKWILSVCCVSIIIHGAFFTYWLSTIFTNSSIRPSDVSCYTTDVYRGLGTFWLDQYLFEWIWAAACFICIIYPFAQVFIFTTAAARAKNTRIFNLFFSSFVFIIFAIYEGITFYELIFCADFNLCRSCNCSQKFNCTANPWYVFRTIFLIYFLLETLTIGFYAFSKVTEKDKIEWLEKEHNQFLKYRYLKSRGNVEVL